MPEESYLWLDKHEVLSFEELGTLVDAFKQVGARRVRITGGEPLVRRDLHLLIEQLAQKGLDDLALTTNGVLLAQQAEQLARAGLGRLTVSLDTLRRDRFLALTRRDVFDDVLAGIEAARAFWGSEPQGEPRLKIDAVVLRGTNDDELCDLLDYAVTVGAELRFIEYMDVGGATRWREDLVVSREQILALVADKLGAPSPLAGRGAAPAERFALPDGRIFGVIASTTAPFCRTCDRSRVTADGMWFHCLYAARGIDLKSPLRSGASSDELSSLLDRGWQRRADRGAEERAAMASRSPLVPISALRRDPHLEMHTRGG
jgi:cyclic pyranopterin phosphate synthase